MMMRFSWTRTLVGVAAMSVLLLGQASAQHEDHAGHEGHESAAADSDADPHAKHRAMLKQQAGSEGSSVNLTFNERTLLDQDGNPRQFPQDVLGERIVVMDFIYTSCTTVCPVLSAIMTQVQSLLGERVGEEVALVSISVDPGRDTPERLKAKAGEHHAGPDWVWLTGEKSSVDLVLKGLGAYTPNFEDHPSMILVGDRKTGHWKRFFGFPGPRQVVAAVDELLASRANESGQAAGEGR